MDHTALLPAELLAYVLDHLAQPDVLRTAALCRRWRDTATDHPRFYAHLEFRLGDSPYASAGSFNWQRIDEQAVRERIHAFGRRVGDVGVHYSIKVVLSTTYVRASSTETLTHADILGQIVDIIGPVLARTVRLCFMLSQLLYDGLPGIFSEPAPVLRSLKLLLDNPYDAVDLAQLPDDLFASAAPALVHISLTRFALAARTYPSVTVAKLHGYEVADFRQICRSFPRMVSLDLDATLDIPRSTRNEERPSFRLDVGAHLKHISLRVQGQRAWPAVFLEVCRSPRYLHLEFFNAATVVHGDPFIRFEPGLLRLSLQQSATPDKPLRWHDLEVTVDSTREATRSLSVDCARFGDTLEQSLSAVWEHVTLLDIRWTFLPRLGLLAPSLPALVVVEIDMQTFTLDQSFSPRANVVLPAGHDSSAATRVFARLALYDSAAKAKLYSSHVFDLIATLTSFFGNAQWDTLRLTGVSLNSPAVARSRLWALFKTIQEDR